MRAHLTPQQRTAAVQPFITRATECVAHSVAADPRSADTSKLGDLIVELDAGLRRPDALDDRYL